MWAKLRSFLVEEGRLVLAVTAYFLVCFGLVGILKYLTLAQYHIAPHELGQAVVLALVLGKVVVVLDKTSFGNRFERHAVWSSVLYKSAIYTLAVAALLVVERVLHHLLGGLTLAESLREAWDASDRNRAAATSICVMVAFIGYNAMSEVAAVVGWRRVRAFFLGPHPLSGRAAPSPGHAGREAPEG
ncbi:MAG: hypothetical protein ACFCGT_16905 [Sandaracinaceae bacterium]